MRTLRTGLTAVAALACATAAWADGPEPQRVSFPAAGSEAITIVADYYPATSVDPNAKTPVVILLHMFKSDRSTWKPLIPALRQKGIAALAIDLRGHGESVGPADAELAERVNQRETRVFKDMKLDVFGAYTWLAENAEVDLSRIGLVGASIGATVALDTAEEDKSIDVIVCLSPGTSYLKIRTEPIIARIQARSIRLISPEDEIANAEALKKVNDAATIQSVKRQNPESDEGNIHGTRMFGQVASIEQQIADYLADKLGRPSTEMVVAKRRGKIYMTPDHKSAEKISAEDKRYYSNADEAIERGLKEIGTQGEGKRGSTGAIGL